MKQKRLTRVCVVVFLCVMKLDFFPLVIWTGINMVAMTNMHMQIIGTLDCAFV